jgi:hypothetical protein
MRKTMIKYNIAFEDVYNMNEKKYMMNVSEATQWVLFLIFFFRFFSHFWSILRCFISHFLFIRRISRLFQKI